MFTSLLKRVLPFILTLIFGIGLGSIFGGSTTRTLEVTPNLTPTRTYKGCPSMRRDFNNSTPSQNRQSSRTPTRNDPTPVTQ